MHRILVGVLALSMAGGECLAQGVTVGGPNAASVAAPTSAEARKAEAKKAEAKKTADEKKVGAAKDNKTSSKISFVSQPKGVKITLSNGRPARRLAASSSAIISPSLPPPPRPGTSRRT